ncbi:two-component regulator propeller domain-containing protein [Robiginitalea sp. SC105]|uniref:hybrid sensor histidine kinase/response regulator transcription factor n=1 Tax=Robiginitalea sp. SC105 TaxID=2762332 RepID=UPI00163B2F9D|nr:two-component regulator propeller domain-containing protein [Robiginitalea sp. SC105]MBC2840401.1 response regulator [Robiginitalea sp. SC105]
MSEDASQNLWVGMQEGGLYRYERASDRFTRFLDDPAHSNSLIGEIVRVVLADSQNKIWIGTGYGPSENGAGLFRFDPITGSISRFIHQPDNPNSLIDNRVSALMEDRQGRIWVGTYQNGLHLYDPARQEFIRMKSDGGKPGRYYPPPGLKAWELPPFISFLYEDQKGGFWIGTCGGGINYFDPGTDKVRYFAHNPAEANGISNDKLWSFFEDKSGQYWLGTLAQGGLHKMDPLESKITRYAETNNMHISGIQECGALPGKLLLGTIYHGLRQLDTQTGEILPVYENELTHSGLRESPVFDIYEDSKGLLWLGFISEHPEDSGTSSKNRGPGGLASLDPKTGKLVRHSFPTDGTPGTAGTSVYRICEDRYGYLWLGAGKYGLFGFDKATGVSKRHTLPAVNGQTSAEVYLIETDSHGTLWVGDQTGEGTLFRYNKEHDSFETFLEGYQAISFYEDSSGWYWVGTEDKGVLRFNPDKSSFHQYTMVDGLPSNRVTGILEGPPGTYWLSTAQGLSRFDAESARFTSKGLPSHRFDKATLSASNGQLYFGGSSVLFAIDPEKANGNQVPPELQIGVIRVSGEPYVLDNGNHGDSESIILAHSQNDITFEYVGLHFSNPARNQYRYRLEPFDPEWIEAGTQRVAQYTNIEPGTYTFRVIASNDNGVWNEEGASVGFVIRKAWWARWWAYLLYGTLLCLLVYSIYRFQLSKKLALAESNRQKQINRFKSNLYTNISHEFRTPLTVILGMTDSLENELGNNKSQPAEDAVRLIRRNGQRLLTLVNEVLELTKLESGHLRANYVQIKVIPFIRYLSESFASYARKKSIQLRINAEIDDLSMDVDTQKLSAILSNLLSNAIKFTPPHGAIELQLQSEKGRFLEIKVHDTGSGIAEEDIPHIFDRFYQAGSATTKKLEGTGIGLALTKELVTGLGGNITATSNPGKGSVFTVRLPITRNAPTACPDALNMVLADPTGPDDLQEAGKVVSAGHPEQPLILIIEDNQDVAHYTIQCLSNAYRTLYARNGATGLELAFEHIPDIVITDVMMPGKDGFEVCKALKKDELTDHIPIIMLTAKATQKDRIFGLSYGADAYLSKPFNKAELLTRIEQLIRVRRKLIRKFQFTGFAKLVESRKKDTESTFIQKAVALIYENISDDSFGPSELASGLLISESQLYRKLKALSGKSTAVFIRHVRLQEAKNLIESTDLTVSEIAYEVGFKNLSWFSRIFKQELGSSPSAIRK